MKLPANSVRRHRTDAAQQPLRSIPAVRLGGDKQWLSFRAAWSEVAQMKLLAISVGHHICAALRPSQPIPAGRPGGDKQCLCFSAAWSAGTRTKPFPAIPVTIDSMPHRNVPLSLRSVSSLAFECAMFSLRWWFEQLHCLGEVLCGAALGQGFPVSSSELVHSLVVWVCLRWSFACVCLSLIQDSLPARCRVARARCGALRSAGVKERAT